ncbi:MAG: hypothetical protein ABIG20_02590 [archaeon]
MKCKVCDCEELEEQGGELKCTKCGHKQRKAMPHYSYPLGGSIEKFTKKPGG